MILNLPVFKTGIRDEEVITGRKGAKQTAGIVAKIRGFYPPSYIGVHELSSSELQSEFNLIPFFVGQGIEYTRQWLDNNSTDNKKLYLEDIQGLRIKFLSFSDESTSFDVLGEGTVNYLLAGDPEDEEGYWDILDVRDMFPRKPGSNPARHTMFFRPNNWSLYIKISQGDSYKGFYFDMDTLHLEYGRVTRPKQGSIHVYRVEDDEIAAVITKTRVDSWTEEYFFDNVSREFEHIDVDHMYEVRDIISWFSPSTHKSLIQKVIRTRCRTVTYEGRSLDPDTVLVTSFIMLMLSPGSFVPNIRKYVTGLESATKRLAVTIMEDSYTVDNEELLSMTMATLIAQEDRSWKPTDLLVFEWIDAAIRAQQDARMFEYETIEPSISATEQYPDDILTFVYLTLKEIGSFPSDINMAHHIAINSGSVWRKTYGSGKTSEFNAMDYMPIVHCIDHHTNTEIVHYMDYPLTYETYPDTIRQIWEQVSAVNPRKPEYKDYHSTMEDIPFVQEVRDAQTYVWTSRAHTPRLRLTVYGDKFEFGYILDVSWLAGMVGPIDVNLRGVSAVVVLDVTDPTQMIAIKKPSRDKTKDPLLTDEETDEAITVAKSLLSDGIVLRNIPNMLPEFKGVTVILVQSDNKGIGEDEDYYELYMNGRWVDWEDARILSYTLPIHKSLDPFDFMNALLYTGDGIDNDEEAIYDVLDSFDLPSLQRLSTYLASRRSKIELHRVSRDGTGTYYQVLPEDTAVNHILCSICVIYPAALVKDKGKFRVKNGPLLWKLTDLINSEITRLSKLDRSDQHWKLPAEEARVRWQHQITALDQMIERHKQGKKGHLIWIPVGMGKTLIVIDYIEYLIEVGDMPEYCVYSLPSSAIDNIVKEFEHRNIPVHILDARKNTPAIQKTITPFEVNLIKHDHMRLGGMPERMKEVAPKMLFIVDEFHKTLSTTIRTSIALELISLSQDFVGLSGTIIKDTHHEELIRWLEYIVDFEVTKNNYWVAVGAMVSRRVYTNVIVQREDIVVEMLPEEREEYYSIVPASLGGTARDLDFRQVIDFCYDIVTVEMIEYIVDFVEEGEEGVFVVARNIDHQEQIRRELLFLGLRDVEIYLFGKDRQITLTPEYDGPIKVVITTPKHSEGYTLTKFRIMIGSVYFTNQATREQLEGRINRIGQTSDTVYIYTLHTGILTNVYEKYEKVRSLSEALKGLATEVGFSIDM